MLSTWKLIQVSDLSVCFESCVYLPRSHGYLSNSDNGEVTDVRTLKFVCKFSLESIEPRIIYIYIYIYIYVTLCIFALLIKIQTKSKHNQLLHFSEPSDDRKIESKTSAEQKKAYTVCTPDVAPQHLNSVYTGRDKVTIENLLKFVSIP